MSKKHNKIKRQKKRRKQTYQPNLLGQRKANNTVRGPKSNWTHSVMTLLMVLATASSTFYMWYKDIAKQRQEQSAKTNFSVRMGAEFHGPDSLKVTSIDSREIRSNNISFAMKLQVTNESERYIHLTRYNVDVTSGSRVVSVGSISISQPQYLVV